MKVKMLQLWASPDGILRPGDVLDVSDAVGESLVAQKAAEMIPEPKLKKLPEPKIDEEETIAEEMPVVQKAVNPQIIRTTNKRKPIIKP